MINIACRSLLRRKTTDFSASVLRGIGESRSAAAHSDERDCGVTAMKNNGNKRLFILMAEDDFDDRLLVKEAFEESRLENELRFAMDGEDLMDYLYHRGKYTELKRYPRPDLILMDLNMPRKDGREALREIKSDSDLRNIPVVVLTTSMEIEDIRKCYDLGANSFITKPVSFEELVEIVTLLGRYWLEIVVLPQEGEGG